MPAIKLIGSTVTHIVEGHGLNASFSNPVGIAINPLNNNLMLISSTSKSSIMQVNLTNQLNSVHIVVNGFTLDAMQLAYDINSTYVYVSTTTYNIIYQVRVLDWNVVVYAGSATYGQIDGLLSIARFHVPRTIICDDQNNLYISDFSNGMVRMITKNQEVSTLAGSGNVTAIATVGIGKTANLPAVTDISITLNGDRFFVLLYGGYVREMSCSIGYRFSYGACISLPTHSQLTMNYVSNIVISSLLGSGTSGSMDGIASVVQFNSPQGMCIDHSGQYLYILCNTSGKIRKSNTSDGLTTTLGKLLLLSFIFFVIFFDDFFKSFLVGTYPYPNYCVVDIKGNLFFTSNNGYIYSFPYNNQTNPANKLIGSGDVTIIEGNGLFASIPNAQGIAIHPLNNQLMLVTTPNFGQLLQINLTNQINSIRKVANLYLHSFQLTYDNNATYVYVGFSSFNAIYQVRVIDWYVVIYAGSRTIAGQSDGIISVARFHSPRTIICDSENNLYIGDLLNNMVRMITPNQQVSTLAGSGNTSSIATVGLGRLANLPDITDIAISQTGNKFYVLLYASYIQEISCAVGYNFSYGACITLPTFNPTSAPSQSSLNYVSNIVINSFIGNGISGSIDGNSSVVEFVSPLGMCMDNNAEHLYISSNPNPSSNGTIRKTNISDGYTSTLGKLSIFYFCHFA